MGLIIRHSASMARIIASVAILAGMSAGVPQSDPSLARILQEQRFNAGAGKFGSAFAQEDGVVYREESVGNNERTGQYSYIGDDGKTYTVKYSAGINGFRILGGDHIPSGGQNSADAITVNSAGEPKEYDYEYYDDLSRWGQPQSWRHQRLHQPTWSSQRTQASWSHPSCLFDLPTRLERPLSASPH